MSSGGKKKNNGLIAEKKADISKKLNENSKGRAIKKETHSKFSDILNKRWKVFRVSTFYNFSFNKFKFYEEKLNGEMNSKKNLTSSSGYVSSFTVNKNFKLNDQCVEALQVRVIKNESQTAYLGFFISWNTKRSEMEGSVSLPILLAEAKTNEMHAVHSSLCKIFDCDIQCVTFSLHALISFFVKLLETPRNNIDVSQEEVIMEYRVPECELNDKIKISLFLEATAVVFAVVMDKLQEKYSGITTVEIIWEFYNKILNHIYHIFNLDLMLAELQKVVFPDAFLTSDGQLKISTDDAAISALNVLERFTPLNAVTNM